MQTTSKGLKRLRNGMLQLERDYSDLSLVQGIIAGQLIQISD